MPVNSHQILTSSHIFLLVDLKRNRCERALARLVGIVITAAIFKVVAVVALAELWARHSRLEALAVVFLAFRFAAVAALKVDLSAVWASVRRSSRNASAHRCRRPLRKIRLLHHAWSYFTLTESIWIAHQDLLFGLEANMVKSVGIVAVIASTLGATESIVCETLAVKFQAATLPAVARFVHLHRCHLRLLLLGLLTRMGCVTWIRLQILQVVRITVSHHKLLFYGLAMLHACVSVVFIDVSCAAVQLDSLRERILHRLWCHSMVESLCNRLNRLTVFLNRHGYVRIPTSFLDWLSTAAIHWEMLHLWLVVVLTLELLEALLSLDRLVDCRGVCALVEIYLLDQRDGVVARVSVAIKIQSSIVRTLDSWNHIFQWGHWV